MTEREMEILETQRELAAIVLDLLRSVTLHLPVNTIVDMEMRLVRLQAVAARAIREGDSSGCLIPGAAHR